MTDYFIPAVVIKLRGRQLTHIQNGRSTPFTRIKKKTKKLEKEKRWRLKEERVGDEG